MIADMAVMSLLLLATSARLPFSPAQKAIATPTNRHLSRPLGRCGSLRNDRAALDAADGGGNQSFLRSTTKYWVRSDDLRSARGGTSWWLGGLPLSKANK